MKKTILSLLIILALAVSCHENDDLSNQALPEKKAAKSSLGLRNADKVSELLRSVTFLRHESFFNSFGSINSENIYYESISIDEFTTDYYNIPIYDNNGTEVAYIEAVRIENTQFLPNNDEYVMNLVDKRGYNTTTKVGNIEMYDVNYGHYKHAVAYAENDHVITWTANGLSADLLAEYADIQNPAKQENLRRRHLCDSNGNGNISFGECFSCIDNAIMTNPTSSTICWVAQFWGPRSLG